MTRQLSTPSADPTSSALSNTHTADLLCRLQQNRDVEPPAHQSFTAERPSHALASLPLRSAQRLLRAHTTNQRIPSTCHNLAPQNTSICTDAAAFPAPVVHDSLRLPCKTMPLATPLRTIPNACHAKRTWRDDSPLGP